MDLLTSFAAPDAAAAACSAACPPSGSGDEPTGEHGGDFLATLTALLGPLHDDEGVAELAAAVADIEGSEGEDGGAVVSIWPLALMAAGDVAARIAEATSTAVPGDQVVTEEGAEHLAAAAPSNVPAAPTSSTDAELVPSAGVHPDAEQVDPDAGSSAGAGPETEPPLEPGLPLESDPQPATGPGSGAAASRRNDAPTESAPAGPSSGVEAARAAPPTNDDGDVPAVERIARPSAPQAEQAEEPSRPAAATTDAPSAHVSVRGSSSGTPGMADGVRRVLEAIELLENAPPPRQITIELGEARLRVALEDGQVRLTVVDGGSDETDDLLAAAEHALAEHGFDLGGQGARDGDPEDRPAAPTTSGASRPGTARSLDRGLRL